MSDLSEVEVARAVALIEAGQTYRRVANSLRVSKSVIHRVVKRYRETGEYRRRRGQGPKRVTNQREDRYITLTALRNRFMPATAVRGELIRSHNVNVSVKTIRRRLRERSLTSRRAKRAPLLTQQHKVERVAYANNYQRWTMREWGRVLFTDESKFSLKSDDNRIRVLRRPNERYSQCNIVGKVQFGGGSIMVWGGISLNGRTTLYILEGGSLTAERYRREILEGIVLPFKPFIGEEMILMHDNARPHVANQVKRFLEEVNLEVLQHPARSPDMNPIEHVWDHMKRSIRNRNPPVDTLAQLKKAVVEEWDRMPQEFVQKLIRSMPRRVNTLLGVRGGNTRY